MKLRKTQEPEVFKQPAILVDDTLLYCANCGQEVQAHQIGEFVLVAPPGTRRYYGRIISFHFEDGTTFVKVGLNVNETEKVRISDIHKAGT